MDCPYPGLRPFTSAEPHIFFGRETQTDELLRRLSATRFLAVVGPSGCGKSSLVRAGMIAALKSGLLQPAGSVWRFAQMRPGSRPIRRLARALFDEAGLRPADMDAETAIGTLTALLLRGPRGLEEVLAENPLPERANLLILVDQFEEIFRFRRDDDAGEADAFVALLLAAAEQTRYPVYVVLTMRSDFFGDCALFAGLPEALNESQYLTPRLSRAQREEAIVGPAEVYGGDIEPSLVNRLLNEMGNDPDQLPLMQHLLMRMWTYRESVPGCGTELLTPRGTLDEDEGRLLTVADYEAVGGLKSALSNHADEAFGRLSAEQQKIAETLFRRLSERGPDNRDVRRPTAAQDIAELAGVDVPALVAVVDAFRAPGCSFVVPPCGETISAATKLDITHESLIRQWTRLREWVDAEARSVDQYQFLLKSAKRWQDEKSDLLGAAALESALAWRRETQPSPAWAKAYDPEPRDFQLVMDFLAKSKKTRDKALKKRQQRQKRKVRRLRLAIAGLAATLAAVVIGGTVLYINRFTPHVAYYSTFAKRWGVAEGVGPLTEDDVRHRDVSLKFVSKVAPRDAWRFHPVKRQVIRMEAVDADGRCSPYNLVGTYLDPNKEETTALSECRWEFMRDADGKVVYEMAYNKLEKIVWGFAYTPPSPDKKHVRKAYFVGSNGFPRQFKNSRAEIFEFEYDDKGLERKITYWDRSQEARPGPDWAYGRLLQYNTDGLVTKMTSIDKGNHHWNDEAGNASLVLHYNPVTKNNTEASYLDKNDKPIVLKEGYSSTKMDYDSFGNQIRVTRYRLGRPADPENDAYRIDYILNKKGQEIKRAYFSTDNSPQVVKNYHKVAYEYNGDGYSIRRRFFDSNDQKTEDKDGCHGYDSEYDDLGRNVSISCFDTSIKKTIDMTGVHRIVSKYNDNNLLIEILFFDDNGHSAKDNNNVHRIIYRYDQRGNRTSDEFYDHTGPIKSNEGFHRRLITYNEYGQETSRSFFGTAGSEDKVIISDNYHRSVSEYDPRGHRTLWAYFGIDGKPVVHKDGYHMALSTYDEQGRRTESRYLGADDKPKLQKEGYATIRTEYDPAGNVVREAYYDENDTLRMQREGYALITKTFDDHGNQTEEAYFGADGKPIVRVTEGYAAVRKQFDGRGNEIEEAFFDTDGAPITGKDGYATVRRVYNGQDRLLEEAYFDARDVLTAAAQGFAVAQATYGDARTATEARYFDERRALIARCPAGGDGVAATLASRCTTADGRDVVRRPLILRVHSGRPAARAGVQAGDAVLSYDGTPVHSFAQLSDLVTKSTDGTHILALWRDGATRSVTVPAGRIGITLGTTFIPADPTPATGG